MEFSHNDRPRGVLIMLFLVCSLIMTACSGPVVPAQDSGRDRVLGPIRLRETSTTSPGLLRIRRARSSAAGSSMRHILSSFTVLTKARTPLLHIVRSDCWILRMDL